MQIAKKASRKVQTGKNGEPTEHRTRYEQQKAGTKCRLRKMVGIGAVGDASAYGKRMRRMQMGAGRGNGNCDLWKANCKKRLIGQPKPMWNSKSDRRMQISRPRKAPHRNFQETILCAKHMVSQSWKSERTEHRKKRQGADPAVVFCAVHPLPPRGPVRKRRQMRGPARGAPRGGPGARAGGGAPRPPTPARDEGKPRVVSRRSVSAKR